MSDVTQAAQAVTTAVTAAPAAAVAAVTGTVKHDEAHLINFVVGHPKTDLIVELVLVAVVIVGGVLLIHGL